MIFLTLTHPIALIILSAIFFPVRLRLRSVMNIQKITKSMKMVSAAKYARAERELQPARVYGAGANCKFSSLFHTCLYWTPVPNGNS